MTDESRPMQDDSTLLLCNVTESVNVHTVDNYGSPIVFTKMRISSKNALNGLFTLDITSDPPLITQDKPIVLNLKGMVTDIDVNEVNSTIHIDFDKQKSDVTDLTIIVNLSDETNIVTSTKAETHIQSKNIWQGLNSNPSSIASFIESSNDTIIKDLNAVLQPFDLGKQKQDGQDPIDSLYASLKPLQVKDLAESISNIIASKIRYCYNDECNYLSYNCRVHRYDDFDEIEIPSELEVAVALDSFFKTAGLNPLIVFVNNSKVFPGLWLCEDCLTDVCIRDQVVVNNLISSGKILMIDADQLLYTGNFNSARDKAITKINSSEDIYAVDVSRYTVVGDRPFINSVERSPGINAEEIDQALGLDYSSTGKIRKITRMDNWERKLLNTQVKNNLINLRITAKKLPLMASSPEVLTKELSNGKSFGIILEKPSRWNDEQFVKKPNELRDFDPEIRELLERDLKNRYLHTPYAREESIKRARALYNQWRTDYEETGSNTLYAAFDSLVWHDDEKSYYSPLVMVPLEIKRSSKTAYSFRMCGEPTLNETFFQKLKVDYNINVIVPEDLLDINDVDLLKIRKFYRELIRINNVDMSGWEVIPSVVLGCFSFNEYMMWRDLKEYRETILENLLVDSLASNELKLNDEQIDDTINNKIMLTDSADGSQTVAINAALNGKTFVLYGPPGTGKSQTITNIITNLLYQGKKVLFVAEKQTALNVVYERLKKIGLERFCLELHSKKTDKSEVLRKLSSNIVEESKKKSKKLTTSYNDLNQLFKEYDSNLYDESYFGYNLRELIGKYSIIDIDDNLIDPDNIDITALPIDFDKQLCNLLTGLKNDLGDINAKTYPLNDSSLRVIEPGMVNTANSLVEQLQEIAEIVNEGTESPLSNTDDASLEKMESLLQSLNVTLDKTTVETINEFEEKNADIHQSILEATNTTEEKELVDRYRHLLEKIMPMINIDDEGIISDCLESIGLIKELEDHQMCDPYSVWPAKRLFGQDWRLSEMRDTFADVLSQSKIPSTYNVTEYGRVANHVDSINGCIRDLIDSGIDVEESLHSDRMRPIVEPEFYFRNVIPGELSHLLSDVRDNEWMRKADPLSETVYELVLKYVDSIKDLEQHMSLSSEFETFLQWSGPFIDDFEGFKELRNRSFDTMGLPFDKINGAFEEELKQHGFNRFIQFNVDMVGKLASTSDSGAELERISADYLRLRITRQSLLESGVPGPILNCPDLPSIIQKLDGVEGSTLPNHLDCMKTVNEQVTSMRNACNQLSAGINILESLKIIRKEKESISSKRTDLSEYHHLLELLSKIDEKDDDLNRAIGHGDKVGQYWDDSIFDINDSDFRNIQDTFEDATKGLMKGRKQKQCIAGNRYIKSKDADFNELYDSLQTIGALRPTVRGLIQFLKDNGQTLLNDSHNALVHCISNLNEQKKTKDGTGLGKDADVIIAHLSQLSEYRNDLTTVCNDIGTLSETNVDILSPDTIYRISSEFNRSYEQLIEWIPIRDRKKNLETDLSERAKQLPKMCDDIDRCIASIIECYTALKQTDLMKNPQFISSYSNGIVTSSYRSLSSNIEKLTELLKESKKHHIQLEQKLICGYNKFKQKALSDHENTVRTIEDAAQSISSMEEMGLLDNPGLIEDIKDGIVSSHRRYIQEYSSKLKQLLMLSRDIDGTKEPIDKLINDCNNHLINISAWAAFNRTLDNLDGTGFHEMTEPLRNGLDPILVGDMFIKSAYHKAIKTHLTEKKGLAGFLPGQFDSDIEEFKKDDSEIIEWNRKEIFDILYNSAYDASNKYKDQTSYLIKENSKKRHKSSLRTMIGEMTELIQSLTPCFLMSPVSVAQYIEPGVMKFDYVIFDEASQIPTHMAIGALARANSAIIVGDPKQLPPTNFFQNESLGDEYDEDEDLEEMESVLDECIKLRMPRSHLRWHYRSSHESLIAFSNHEFYDDSLFTFPSPDDLTRKVNMVKVDGNYQSGASKRYNDKEAQSLVDDLDSMLMDPKYDGLTIGVIAFGAPQRDCIDRHLAICLDDENKYRRYEEHQVFVKNLENVQGDERDIILFSVGYGRENGKMISRFGPISMSGGWRRLNVAVTRAKMEMRIYSSITKDDVVMTNKGNKGLHDFLEYAEMGTISSEESKSDRSDLIADSIAHELSKHNYKTVRDVGKSDYKVDLAVVNPDYPEEYILAILTDGVSFHSTTDIRDRMFTQEDMLKRLNWNVLHVWALGWYYDQPRTLDNIIKTIEKCRKTRKNELSSVIGTMSTESGNDDDEIVYRKYQVARVESKVTNHNRFLSANATEDCLATIDAILEIEAPISEDDLYKRLISTCDLERNSHSRGRMEELLYMGGYEHTIAPGGVKYIWSKTMDPSDYREFRDTTKVMASRSGFSYEEAVNAFMYNMDRYPSVDGLLEKTAEMLGSGGMEVALGSLRQSYERALNENAFSRPKKEKAKEAVPDIASCPDIVEKDGVLLSVPKETIGRLNLDNRIETVGPDACKDCTGISEVSFGDNITIIKERSFAGCSGLTNLSIPGNVQNIMDSAFEGCTGLTSLSIAEGVSKIKKDAFSGCTSLSGELTIPSSVGLIGKGAFKGCPLKIVHIRNKMAFVGDAFDSGVVIDKG